MKPIASIIVILFSFSFVQSQDLLTSIRDFAGMAGCWERSDRAKSLMVSEQWMKPAGTSILGMGRTVKEGKTVDHEFMRIEQRNDGIYFIAKPMANVIETSFKLRSFQPGIATFENPDHDFPQRVIYNFAKPDVLGARIEGTLNGKERGVDFPYVRAKCG